MTEYTHKDLNSTARNLAKDTARETKHPAKVVDWKVHIDGSINTCLIVTIAAYDGLRQRNCAI